jgi:hypothetical protein
LQRKYTKPKYIIGNLLNETGNFICNTLENAEKKIPEGTYKIYLTLSPKLDRITPELFEVPDRSDIRIHAGNSVADTEGCILVGINDTVGQLSDSRNYEQKITDIISKSQDNCIDIFRICP